MLRRLLLSFTLLLLALACAGAGAHAAQATHARMPQARFAYIELPPMVLTSSSEQSIIAVTLEVAQDRKAAVEGMRARLTEAFALELQDRPDAPSNMMQGQTVNIAAIKARLMKAAEKVLGPDVVHGILLDVLQGRI